MEDQQQRNNGQNQSPGHNEIPGQNHPPGDHIHGGAEFDDDFPPGYRFKPYDEELVFHYLRPKILDLAMPQNRIKDVDLYSFNPETLAKNYQPLGENEWYFFTPRERKYKNGKRPKRAAVDGYWKATGADKNIKKDKVVIGFKKSLVFYTGNPPVGKKSEWIMHEFRFEGHQRIRSSEDDMRLDDCVLCRIYKKGGRSRLLSSRLSSSQRDDSDLDDPQSDDEEFQDIVGNDNGVEGFTMLPTESIIPRGPRGSEIIDISSHANQGQMGQMGLAGQMRPTAQSRSMGPAAQRRPIGPAVPSHVSQVFNSYDNMGTAAQRRLTGSEAQRRPTRPAAPNHANQVFNSYDNIGTAAQRRPMGPTAPHHANQVFNSYDNMGPMAQRRQMESAAPSHANQGQKGQMESMPPMGPAGQMRPIGPVAQTEPIGPVAHTNAWDDHMIPTYQNGNEASESSSARLYQSYLHQYILYNSNQNFNQPVESSSLAERPFESYAYPHNMFAASGQNQFVESSAAKRRKLESDFNPDQFLNIPSDDNCSDADARDLTKF